MVKLTDLSSGGFAFLTDDTLWVNDTVSITASSATLGLEGVQSKIAVLSQHYGSSRTLYHGKFINIEFAKEEQIVRYVLRG